MASLVKRGNRYCVVYTYETDAGVKKQKWENENYINTINNSTLYIRKN